MGKNIKKNYIPPYVDLLSVDEDDLIMLSGTGRTQGWDDAKKSIFFDDEEIPESDTGEAEWINSKTVGD